MRGALWILNQVQDDGFYRMKAFICSYMQRASELGFNRIPDIGFKADIVEAVDFLQPGR